MLITYLPPEAITRRIAGDESAGWGHSEQLLAAAVDALHAANWQRGGRGTRPKPIARPGVRRPTLTLRHGSPEEPERAAQYLAQFLPPPLEVANGN